MVHLAIISDTRLYRDGLAQVLERSNRFHIVATLSALAEVRDVITSPGVVLLDIGVPEALDSIRLVHETTTAPVVALGLLDSEAEVLAAAEAGASGFVLRDATLDELIDCLETVARGDLRCSPSIAGALLRRLGALAGERPRGEPMRDITWREREVLGLVEQGLSNKAIAVRLSIEVTTVKNHIHNILEKLGVRRRSDAAATLRHLPAARRAGALKI